MTLRDEELDPTHQTERRRFREFISACIARKAVEGSLADIEEDTDDTRVPKQDKHSSSLLKR